MSTTHPPLTVYINEFDSHEKRTPAGWTAGAAYVVVYGDKKFVTGHIWRTNRCRETTQLMTDEILEKMDVEAFASWKVTTFKMLPLICQEALVFQMENIFPWELSFWNHPYVFHELYEPQTLIGKIEKSIRDQNYFYNNFYNKSDWYYSIQNSWVIIDNHNYTEMMVKINDEIFKVTAGYQPHKVTTGYQHKVTEWAILVKLSNQEALQIFNQIEELRNELAKSKKEHARMCSKMARKYSIPFEISLRCFKGNEEDIKVFVSSLKEAIGKDYNANELCCGRARRRAEIERLGIVIGNVDPNHIAPYVLDCLMSHKIVC